MFLRRRSASLLVPEYLVVVSLWGLDVHQFGVLHIVEDKGWAHVIFGEPQTDILEAYAIYVANVETP